MTELGLITEVKTQLIAQTWTGSSTVVFPVGSVYIVPSIADALQQALNTQRVPIALIESGTAESDPEFDEEPNLIRFTFNIAIVTAVAGDVVGQNFVIGANKVGGSTSSEGRGIVELAQEFHNAVGVLNALEGLTIQVRQKAEQLAAFRGPNMWIGYRVYACEAWGTAV